MDRLLLRTACRERTEVKGRRSMEASVAAVEKARECVSLPWGEIFGRKALGLEEGLSGGHTGLGVGCFCCHHVTHILEGLFRLPLHPHCMGHQGAGLPREGTVGVAMSARTHGTPCDVWLTLGKMVTH